MEHRPFVEHDEFITRWELSDGYADLLLHHSWWKWKPWTSCICIWTHGGGEPTILHRRFWTRRSAAGRLDRATFEMSLEASRG